MKRNKLIVGIGLLLIGVFSLYGFAAAEMTEMTLIKAWGTQGSDPGQFDSPHDVAVDSAGDVYVADRDNHRIQKFEFDNDGNIIDPPITWYGFVAPYDVAVDSNGNIYVTDQRTPPTDPHKVHKIDEYGVISTLWDSATQNPSGGQPYGIEVDANDHVYVTISYPTASESILRFNDAGSQLSSWGPCAEVITDPFDIAFDSQGFPYVAQAGTNQGILRSSDNGLTCANWENWLSASDPDSFSSPGGIAFDSQDNVYVADTGTVTPTGIGRILIFDSSQAIVVNCKSFWNNDTGAWDSFNKPVGIAVDSNGYIYVADRDNHRILKFAPPANDPPIILGEVGEEITAPVDPVEVNTVINVSATFTDPDVGDTHTATWGKGDNSTYTGTVTEPSEDPPPQPGAVSGSHSYTTPGVYTLTLTVTDQYCESDNATFQYVVVYDPDGGFVIGGGWIDSPEGAYEPDPSLTGKANFGFVSKYKKGATVPTGETEFHFKAADMNFHSSSYEWLVVANHKAMYKGCGTINGEGNYGFMLSAIDAALSGSTDVDLFRIKIWDKDYGDEVVYDNQMGAGDDADPTTEIGGGSIVIHQ